VWRLGWNMSNKLATTDLRLAEIANRQHGVVSLRQLTGAGINRHAVHHRVRIGHLHPIHRGVYAVGHSSLSNEARWMAAVLACGRPKPVRDVETMTILDFWGAALSHRSALSLWALLPSTDGPVDVLISGVSGRGRRASIRLHRSRSLSPADVTLRKGIPVTRPARAIADIRRVVSRPGALGLISPRELRRAIRQADVLGVPLGDDEKSDGTRSDLERDFLRLCRRHRLPAPEVNVRVGSHLVDFLWRERRLVVETDGYAYHSGRAAFQDDRARDLDLRARGFEVIRLAEKQVNEEPRRVAEVVGAALRVGADGAEAA
jgi:very-short-patch-repair endonuclease